jgi:hypothetical protein
VRNNLMTLEPSTEAILPLSEVLNSGLSVLPQAVEPQAADALAKSLHSAALELFRQHRFTESQEAIMRAVATAETSIRWNDFATIAVARNDAAGAERGYRRAVELDPKNVRAATNLDMALFTLLRSIGSFTEEEVREWSVFNPDHKLHAEFLQVLEAPEMRDPIVAGSLATFMGNEHPEMAAILDY